MVRGAFPPSQPPAGREAFAAAIIIARLSFQIHSTPRLYIISVSTPTAVLQVEKEMSKFGHKLFRWTVLGRWVLMESAKRYSTTE